LQQGRGEEKKRKGGKSETCEIVKIRFTGGKNHQLVTPKTRKKKRNKKGERKEQRRKRFRKPGSAQLLINSGSKERGEGRGGVGDVLSIRLQGVVFFVHNKRGKKKRKEGKKKKKKKKGEEKEKGLSPTGWTYLH